MKKFIYIILFSAVLLPGFGQSLRASEEVKTPLVKNKYRVDNPTWSTNYKEAQKEARRSQKFLLVYSFDKYWGVYSTRVLEQDALKNDEFKDMAGHFIMVKVDNKSSNRVYVQFLDHRGKKLKRLKMHPRPNKDRAAMEVQLLLKVMKSITSKRPLKKDLTVYFIPLLKDKDPVLRAYAANALGDLGKLPKTALAALAKAVADKDLTTRYNAIRVLEKQGTNAISAQEELIKHIHTDYGLAICVALSKIMEDKKELVALMIGVHKQAIKDNNKNSGMGAALALGSAGPDAKDATKTLRDGVVTNNKSWREFCKHALRKINPE